MGCVNTVASDKDQKQKIKLQLNQKVNFRIFYNNSSLLAHLGLIYFIMFISVFKY